MESLKAKRIGRRIFLGSIGALGAAHFALSLGEIDTLWDRISVWYYICFFLPYTAMLLAFAAGFVLAGHGQVRYSAAIILVALICSVGLFFHDVHESRALWPMPFDFQAKPYHLVWWWRDWDKPRVRGWPRPTTAPASRPFSHHGPAHPT